MGGGEIGRERIRVFVEQKVHPALAIHGDRAAAMAQHRGEAHLAEVVVQLRGLAGGGGEFDEFEPVDAHRIFEGGDLHARVRARCSGVRLCAHRRFSTLGRPRGYAGWQKTRENAQATLRL